LARPLFEGDPVAKLVDLVAPGDREHDISESYAVSIPTSIPSGSSSASRSSGRSPCRLRSCCSTRSPRRSTPSS
jgi:hypothetical protein